jgi:hypothetical protein
VILRVAFTAAGASVAAAAALAVAPASSAAQRTVGASDRVETPHASCTVAYTYAGHDDHTCALTAGHCQDSPRASVEDKTGRATGTFVHGVVDAPGSGGSDYRLIDFGRIPLAAGTLWACGGWAWIWLIVALSNRRRVHVITGRHSRLDERHQTSRA